LLKEPPFAPWKTTRTLGASGGCGLDRDQRLDAAIEERRIDLPLQLVRTIQNPVFLDTINALGANAVPMPFTELYTALESKALDGQEGPYTTILTSKLNEVQQHISPTQHIYGAVVVIVSKRFWDQLSGNEREVLKSSCTEARDYERAVSREMSPKSLAELKQKGMVFTDIAPDEMSRMRAKVKPVVDKYAKEVGETLMAKAQAEIEKSRQQR